MTTTKNRSEPDPTLAMVGALIDLQGELKCVPKSKGGQEGHQLYQYAPLDEIADHCRELLHKYGFGVSHSVERVDGATVLRTTVLHRDGARLVGDLPIDLTGRTKQRGSELTYARRYNTMLVLNIVPEDEDDDAKAANIRPAESAPQSRSAAATEPAAKTGGNGAQEPATLLLSFADPDTGEIFDAPVKRTHRDLREAVARIEASCEVDADCWDRNREPFREIYQKLGSLSVDTSVAGNTTIKQWCEAMQARYGADDAQ